MNQRTPKSEVAIRGFIGVFVISMGIAWVWNTATGTKFWSVAEIGLGSLFIVGGFGLFGWIIVNVGTRLFCGRDPQFQNYVRNGGDPYFDTLPRPLNPDSQTTRNTGIAEPKTGFKPPRNWTFVCPQCGARQPSRVCVCWNCNYGANGDSSAYFQRWGAEGKPADLSPQEWAAYQRGESPRSGCEGGSCGTGDDNNDNDGYDGWIPVDEQPRPPS